MKYTMQSSKYVCKNFIYLFPFAILPAVFLSISTDQKAIVSVIQKLLSGEINGWKFSEIFRAISVLNFASVPSIVFGIVGIIIIVPCVALLMALLEKHMRIGKRTFNGLWGKLNDNFLSTFVGVFLLIGIYEIWTLLLSAFLFFMSRIPVLPVSYAISAIGYVTFHIVLMIGISTIYLWLPCMQITGFRPAEALQYSYYLMGDVKGRIIAAQLAVLLAVEVAIVLCAAFIPGIAFNIVVAVLYAGVIMIFCVRMQVAYFDRDHIERADTAKYYHK